MNQNTPTKRSTTYLCIFRIYDKKDDRKTKNDHIKEMVVVAYKRGFRNMTVLADSVYVDTRLLKDLRRYGWHFIVSLKSNHIVSLKSHEEKHLSDVITGDNESSVISKTMIPSRLSESCTTKARSSTSGQFDTPFHRRHYTN